MRALSAEGVLSLNPSLILSRKGAGPPNVIEVLRKANVPFVSVSDDATAQGVLDKIRIVSRVMNVPEKGKALVDAVAAQLDSLKNAVAGLSERKKVLFILSLTDGRR